MPAARAGDAKAQCRLGVELGACQMVMNHLEGLRRAIRRGEAAADTRGDESFALRLAEFELVLTERRAACSTLDLDALM